MRTMTLLQTATTPALARAALATARARGWTDTLAAKHGTPQVRALVQAPCTPKAPQRVAAPKPSPVAQQLAPAWQRIPVALGNGVEDVLVLAPARPSPRAATGTTHDAHLLGGTDRFTLSPAALSRLLTGTGTRIPVGGRLVLATRV